MRRCPHTGLSTDFRLSTECDRCRADDAARTLALLSLLNPLRWFRRRERGWPNPISRKSLPAQVRDGGTGSIAEQPCCLESLEGMTPAHGVWCVKFGMSAPAPGHAASYCRPDYSSTIAK